MPERVLILGAGGHGQVVADALRCMAAAGRDVRPIGFLDDDASLHGQILVGLPVLGTLNELSRIPHDTAVVAMGNNETRHDVFCRLQRQGERFAVVCHPHAIIANNVAVGAGSVILAGAIINTGTVIGVNVIVNTGSSIDHHNQIGDHVHVAPGVHTGGDVHIHDGVLLGIGATVMPGRTVAAWSTVGAAALVHRDVAARTTVIGVPAKPLKER